MLYRRDMSHLVFPLRTTRVTTTPPTPAAIPFRFSFFVTSNLARLHHMRWHHHEQRGKSLNWRKTEREESQTNFWRGTATANDGVSEFPSFPLFNCPSPHSGWHREVATWMKRHGLGFRIGRGWPRKNSRERKKEKVKSGASRLPRGYCSTKSKHNI